MTPDLQCMALSGQGGRRVQWLGGDVCVSDVQDLGWSSVVVGR